MRRKLEDRIRGMHPDHYAIVRSMAWIALFVLIGAVGRAGKDIAIANRYGIGAEVDAYVLVFNLVTWPVTVWFGVLTAVLVPLAARIRRGHADELPRFRSEVLGLALLVALALACVSWLALPPLLRASWIGLPQDSARLALDMFPTLSLLLPLGIVTSLLSAWMLSASRHVSTLLSSVPEFVILLVVLAVSTDGVQPLVWGTLTGYVFHLVSLALPVTSKADLVHPRFSRESPHWTPFWQGFGFMLVGQVLMSITGIIDQLFSAPIGSGAIATLNYANRILLFPLGLGALAIARATLPVFSDAHALGEQHSHQVAARWINIMFALGIATLALGWMLSPSIVRLLFEHGRFTAENTGSVAEVLRYALLQLPFYFAGLVCVSYLASRQLHVWLFWSGVSGLITKLIGNALLVPIFGVVGIVVATACTYAINFGFLCYGFQRAGRESFRVSLP